MKYVDHTFYRYDDKGFNSILVVHAKDVDDVSMWCWCFTCDAHLRSPAEAAKFIHSGATWLAYRPNPMGLMLEYMKICTPLAAPKEN